MPHRRETAALNQPPKLRCIPRDVLEGRVCGTRVYRLQRETEGAPRCPPSASTAVSRSAFNAAPRLPISTADQAAQNRHSRSSSAAALTEGRDRRALVLRLRVPPLSEPLRRDC